MQPSRRTRSPHTTICTPQTWRRIPNVPRPYMPAYQAGEATMMGRSHAASGAVVGLALAPALGLDTTEAVPFAVAVAGYAIFPDLDCGGATASRLLGPATKALSWLVCRLSALVYRITRTDTSSSSAGTHRHLTHTVLFALAMGALAWSTALASPWVVAGWLAFGVLSAGAALSDLAALVAAAAAAIPLATSSDPLAALADMQPWVGIAVGLGCVVHLAGDGITVSGIPALWPLPIGGKPWHELHLLPRGFRLHTGHKVETWLLYPAFLAGCLLLAWPLLEGHLPPGITDTVTHVAAQL